ncbi:MAG: head decoration protein [Gammaproteobacteria bacterium]|nr:head decoration protein [Gammaproteobacteria bacterium]
MPFDPHASSAEDTLSYSNLIAGDKDLVTAKVTIAAGAALTAGAVLGKITASGKYALSASAAGDGSETPDAILANDVDAAAADAEAVVYLEAEVNVDALSFGTGHDATSVRDALRQRGIYLRTVY